MAATPEGENSNNQHLPQDVIVEILLRLPVKSLLRFRLVSKSWMSQIESPVFIKLHLDLSLINSSTSSSFIVDCYKKDTEEKLISLENCVNLNYNITKSRSRIVGSCNGLVCLLNYYPNIVVWNPATNQARPLPKPIIIGEPNLVKVGFGFDAVANDYKVVRIAFQNSKYSHARIEVYSVNNGYWREIKIEFPFCRLFGDTCSAIVRGDPYFLVPTALEEVWLVVSFDMHNEIIRHALSLPEVCKNYRSCWDLTSFKDLLVVVIHSPNLEEGFSFWTMDVNDSGVKASWTLTSQVVPFPEKTYRVGYLKNGEIVARNAKGEVFMYDPKTKEIKDVRIPVDTRMGCVYNYIGTLVPIRGSKQVPTNPKRRKRYFWGK